MGSKRIAGFSSILLVLAVIAGGLYFRQDIFDWYVLRSYQPPAEIASLATDTTMLDTTRKVFYVNKPVIANKETFNQYCRNNNEQSIVLGCYLSGQRGIYLFDIQDDRLSGVKEVTAAHEVLHAVYDRLSNSEREKVNKMLLVAYEGVTSNRIRESVELYRKQDPNIVNNELHSILGSEVRNLPEELEAYYSQYFSKRTQIVAYSERYEQAFVERRNMVRDYDAQLSSLKKDIESMSEELKIENQELTNLRDQLNSLKVTNIEEHNQKVPEFNSRVNSYNKATDELTAKINQYNDIVQKRNDIVSEESELMDAIDSRQVILDRN